MSRPNSQIRPVKGSKRVQTKRAGLAKSLRRLEKAALPQSPLRKLREEKGWSQVELAKKSRTSQSYLSALEVGRERLGSKVAKRLAKVLGVNVEQIRPSDGKFYGGRLERIKERSEKGPRPMDLKSAYPSALATNALYGKTAPPIAPGNLKTSSGLDFVKKRIQEQVSLETANRTKSDPIHHPSHYTQHPSGVECIVITEAFNFNVGNAIKYCWRAGLKEGTSDLQDLGKAKWYLEREIQRRQKIAWRKEIQEPILTGSAWGAGLVETSLSNPPKGK